jgi:hypothetical protein
MAKITSFIPEPREEEPKETPVLLASTMYNVLLLILAITPYFTVPLPICTDTYLPSLVAEPPKDTSNLHLTIRPSSKVVVL